MLVGLLLFKSLLSPLHHKLGVSNHVADALSLRHAFTTSMQINDLGFEQIKNVIHTYPNFGALFPSLENGEDLLGYKFSNGYLFWGTSLCVPKGSLCTLVMQVQNAGHFGVDKMVAFVRTRFYGSSVDRDVANFVKRSLSVNGVKALLLMEDLIFHCLFPYIPLPIPTCP